MRRKMIVPLDDGYAGALAATGFSLRNAPEAGYLHSAKRAAAGVALNQCAPAIG